MRWSRWIWNIRSICRGQCIQSVYSLSPFTSMTPYFFVNFSSPVSSIVANSCMSYVRSCSILTFNFSLIVAAKFPFQPFLNLLFGQYANSRSINVFFKLRSVARSHSYDSFLNITRIKWTLCLGRLIRPTTSIVWQVSEFFLVCLIRFSYILSMSLSSSTRFSYHFPITNYPLNILVDLGLKISIVLYGLANCFIVFQKIIALRIKPCSNFLKYLFNTKVYIFGQILIFS